MANQEIIEKLKEHQREIGNMEEGDVESIFMLYDWADTRSGYLATGLEHGLQIAIDLLEGR